MSDRKRLWAVVCISLSIVVLFEASVADPPVAVFLPGPDAGGASDIGGPYGDITPEQLETAERRIAAYRAANPPDPDARAVVGAAQYPFYPQAGLVYGDLWGGNYVDMDGGVGVLDWDCSEYTYDNHGGHDTALRSFGEQAAGVPVFAALDGTVMDTHDGEPDMNTSCAGMPNYVTLDHGGTHETWYYHLRNGSIAVSVGQFVPAGTQLGYTASSGCSTAPHLHFESRFGGARYEPSTGACNPGTSGWENQDPIRRDTYLSEFHLSNSDFRPWTWPDDVSSRSGHVLSGSSSIYMGAIVHNLPALSTWRTIVRRPDNSLRFDSGAIDFNNVEFLRRSIRTPAWALNFDVTGTWTIEYLLNDVSMVVAPLQVVTSGPFINRQPNPIDVMLDPADPGIGDAVLCRVLTSLTLDDPDYDLLSYEYEWKVNGVVVRNATHAGHADALPAGLTSVRDVVTCKVLATDGGFFGPSADTSVIVGGVGTGCPTVPFPDCPGFAVGQANAQLDVRAHDDGIAPTTGSGFMKLKMNGLEETSLDEFGAYGGSPAADATMTDDLGLCLYDNGILALTAAMDVPAPTWTCTKASKCKFKGAQTNGLVLVKLKADTDFGDDKTKTKLFVKINAKKSPLGSSVVELQNPWDEGADTLRFDGAAADVDVQVYNRATDRCWAANFGASNPAVDPSKQKNDPIGGGKPRFKSKIKD